MIPFNCHMVRTCITVFIAGLSEIQECLSTLLFNALKCHHSCSYGNINIIESHSSHMFHYLQGIYSCGLVGQMGTQSWECMYTLDTLELPISPNTTKHGTLPHTALSHALPYTTHLACSLLPDPAVPPAADFTTAILPLSCS